MLEGQPLEISDGLTALGVFRQERSGEDKTHIFYTVALSDGLRNYVFEERGKRYDSVLYSDSDTDEEVSKGFDKVVAALRQLRGPKPRNSSVGRGR